MKRKRKVMPANQLGASKKKIVRAGPEKSKTSPRKRSVKRASVPAGKVRPTKPASLSATRSSKVSRVVPIVGVGASAGGLEAYTELLRHLPADTGMAFVLVQHLDPQHASALVQLLSRATAMPVREVTDGLRVEPDLVYVIPRNKLMTIANGILRLSARKPNRVPTFSIDLFLESLAHDQREHAIGVILSGAATDGTLGLEAIKAEGGITFAQDQSATYDSMPRSAVAAGCVDFELSPEKIARELARIAKHPLVSGNVPERNESNGASAAAHRNDNPPLPSGGHGKTKATKPDALTAADREPSGSGYDKDVRKILLLVRNHTGVDFSLYKSATIQRRLVRRVVLNQLATHSAYAEFLRGNTVELDALFSDMLISVTCFFRNPEAFDFLQRKVFPQFLAERSDTPVRFWILGCSTGQEAYSLAMAFAETAGNSSRARKLQIFATDLNDSCLEKARAGFYAKSLAQDISPERLRRFFVEEEGGYRATKELRQSVVFARQNVLSDPPFSRMDLVSCRNLLIYFDQGWQKKIIPMFHYALNPGGVLFLGASESVAGFAELFDPLDKKHKVFGKLSGQTPTLKLPTNGAAKRTEKKTAPPQLTGSLPDTMRPELSAQREADRITINQFAPPGVLINDAMQILQFRGATGAYLEPPLGNASFNVLKMAREGLMLPLRTALNKARKENKPVTKAHVAVEQNGESCPVTLRVIPLKNLKERCFLIMFVDEQKHSAAASDLHAGDRQTRVESTVRLSKREESRRIQALEAELAETRDYLQSIQEQHEASGEELQASNEEVTSANEELQSINEELETSKEELESANEEMTTVNEEMAGRNTELNHLNADLNNLNASINTAILVLRRDLTIRRFTGAAERIFNLLGADLGRPLSSLRHSLEFPPTAEDASRKRTRSENKKSILEGLVREVIDTISVREREVQDRDGHWYLLRIRPYLTLDQKIDGAVLVLEDIDLLKRSELVAKSAQAYAEAALRTSRTPLLVLRPDLRVNTGNAMFYKTFKVTPLETEGRLLWELGQGEWKNPRLRELLEEILPRNKFFDEFEIQLDFPGLGTRTLLLNARRLETEEDAAEMILLAIEDVTDRRRLDDTVRLSEERFRTLAIASDQIVWTANAEGRVCEDSSSWRTFTGQTIEQWKGLGGLEVVHPDDRDKAGKDWLKSVATKCNFVIEFRLRRADGTYRWMSVRAVPVLDHSGGVREWIGANIDITIRKQSEALLACQKRAFEMVTQGASLSDVLDFLVRTIEIESPLPAVAAIHRLDESGERFEKTTAPSLPSAYHQAVNGTAVAANTGCCCAAVAGRRPVIVPDIAASKEYPAYAALVIPFGLRAAWSAPIIGSSGKVLGSLVNYYREVGEPGPRELILGEIVTRTAAIVIERKEAEEQLRASEGRYRSLFTSMDEGFCVIEVLFDAAGRPVDYRFLDVNPAFEKQSGLHEVVGRRVLDLIPDLETFWMEIFGKVALTGEPVRFVNESVIMKRWFDLYAFRLGGQASRKVAVLFKDISETKRTAAELQIARDEALASSLAKDNFLATLSHELRTPLNPVLLLASDAAANDELPEAVRADFETIRKNIRLEARLIDDLLDLTRISRGTLKIELQPCDAHAVLRDAVAVVRSDLDEKHIQFAINLGENQAVVMADPVRLEQIFWNVLRNAVHFTPKNGSIAIESLVSSTGDKLEIKITDSGIGIAPEDLKRIFQAFVQGDAAPGAPRRSGGLGLGLAISHNLVEMHAGSISVSSPGRGGGSSFVIKLPLTSAAGVNPRSVPEGTKRSKEPFAPRGRILIVDDHVPTISALRRIVQRWNFEVHTAGSVVEAVRIASESELDFVISDIGLPDGDGYSVMSQLKALHPRVLGIALSGYGTESDLAKSRDAGFVEHLTKPVNTEDLEQALQNLSNRK